MKSLWLIGFLLDIRGKRINMIRYSNIYRDVTFC